MDNTVVQTEYEVLLNLVESLKSKLKEERTKNLNLEKNIREELCNEFNQMMVDVEQGYEKRIQVFNFLGCLVKKISPHFLLSEVENCRMQFFGEKSVKVHFLGYELKNL